MSATPAPPPCPIMGQPAKRLVQSISARLLAALWRYSMGVEIRPLIAGIRRFHLWESPCGLAFFDPMLPGDTSFYRDFYRRIAAHERLSQNDTGRPEMQLAARPVRPGARVLDVGCGHGTFAAYVPEARYVGLDPHFAGVAPHGRDIRAETIEQHAAAMPGSYDVALALQVIEHVTDPVGFARSLVVTLKPGGVLQIGVPSWPSELTAIPNFVLNAPPHHLTWWTEDALRALATRLGLETEAVLPIPPPRYTGLVSWMARLAAQREPDVFFKASWRWHAALAWGWAAGSVLDKLFGAPATAQPHGLLLVARKPG